MGSKTHSLKAYMGLIDTILKLCHSYELDSNEKLFQYLIFYFITLWKWEVFIL